MRTTGAPPDIDDLIDRLAAYRSTLDDAIAIDLDGPHQRRRRRSAPGRTRVLSAAAAVVVLGVAGLVMVDARRAGAPTITGADDVTPADPGPTEPPSPPSSSQVDTDGERADGLVPLTRPLRLGDTGDDVVVLEQQLARLGFAPGPIDGTFDGSTESAVWAFEKLVMDVAPSAATGVVDDELWAQLHDAIDSGLDLDPAPSDAERHIEIHLPEQLLVVYEAGEPVVISHISTGSDEMWCDETTISPGEHGNEHGAQAITDRRCGRSTTPAGVFEVHRRVEGTRDTSHGRLVDPLYFNYGIAISASDDVPLDPVTRGEVRVTAGAMTAIVERGGVGVGVPVWVFDGVNDPASLGAQPPTFDWSDPDGSATPTSTPADWGTSPLLAVGDSVMLPTAPLLTELGFVVDAHESRQLVDVLDRLSLLVADGGAPDVVVIHLGTNGTISDDAVERLVTTFPDSTHVVLLTVSANRSWTHRNNEILRAASERHPHVTLLDWAERAAECRPDCFASDGIHLRSNGQQHYVDLIDEHLDQHLDQHLDGVVERAADHDG